EVFAHCNNDEVHVSITRSLPSPAAAIFGNYKRKQPSNMPSLTEYSWEKAFYGVENEEGITDPRLDSKISEHPVWRKNDLSPLPGLQSGAYSIHVLSALNPNIGSKAAEKLFETKQAVVREPQTKNAWKVTVTDIPAYSANDMWLIKTQVFASKDFSARG